MYAYVMIGNVGNVLRISHKNSKFAANTGDQNLWNWCKKSQVRVSGNQPYKHILTQNKNNLTIIIRV